MIALMIITHMIMSMIILLITRPLLTKVILIIIIVVFIRNHYIYPHFILKQLFHICHNVFFFNNCNIFFRNLMDQIRYEQGGTASIFLTILSERYEQKKNELKKYNKKISEILRDQQPVFGRRTGDVNGKQHRY